jgi:hypothetical protein
MADDFEQVETQDFTFLSGCSKAFSSFGKAVFIGSDTEEKDKDREMVEPLLALDGAW